MIATATINFKQGNQLKVSKSCSNSENFNLRNHVGKRKKVANWHTAPGVITFGSELVSIADSDGSLISSFSVFTVTTNTNMSTPTTTPTTPQGY